MNRFSNNLFSLPRVPTRRHVGMRLALAALIVAIVPFAAQAADLSYSYLQGGYQFGHNASGRDSHGWSGTAAAAIGNNFQIIGGYARTDRDNSYRFPNQSADTWSLGGGFHTGINANTDFVTHLDYKQASIDGVSRDLHTWSGEAGVRSALAPKVEGWVMAGYGDTHNPNTGNSHDEFFGKLGGQYKFNKQWGLVADGKISHDDRSLFVGPRFSF